MWSVDRVEIPTVGPGCATERTLKRTLPLFDSDGFGEVARLIDVAAAADGDVVGEKLERDDFEERDEKLRRGRKLDDVIGGGTSEVVAGGDNGDNDTVPGADFLHV